MDEMVPDPSVRTSSLESLFLSHPIQPFAKEDKRILASFFRLVQQFGISRVGRHDEIDQLTS